MKSRQLNFKMINILVLALIIFLIYLMRELWMGIISKTFEIITPFIIGFTIAYVLYPLSRKLHNKGVPKYLAITIIYVVLLLFIGLILWLFVPSVLPLLFEQTTSLFSSLIKFIQDMSSRFDVNLGSIKSTLSHMSNQITSGIGDTISKGAINIINESINILSKILIAFIASVYFIIDMGSIRKGIKNYLYKKNKRTFAYVKALDEAVYNYFRGLSLYIIIQLFEYTFIYYLIGHPNYLLLGILSAVTTIIPYFGGIVTNIIAIITAAVVNTKLLVLTIIVSSILPNTDGNIISPRIFNKTNQVPALLTIFAVFAGGVLYGVTGIIIALPLTIVLLTTYRFYRKDINEKIDKIKRKR